MYTTHTARILMPEPEAAVWAKWGLHPMQGKEGGTP